MEINIPVLDKGFVRVEEWLGNDLSVVRHARQSFDAAWRAGRNEESDTKLINYLMRNKHSTPFESVEIVFEIKAPIFVIRQWSRHRTWRLLTINELSARYKELKPEFYVPDPSIVGQQAKSNKQGREETQRNRSAEVDSYTARCQATFREYEWLLSQDWPKELARVVLPLSTYTSLSLKVDLWNLFHFLDLRTHEHAQYEIRQYAKAILESVQQIAPTCVNAWKSTNMSLIAPLLGESLAGESLNV